MPTVAAFQLANLIAQAAGADAPYLEFLRVPDLSLGLYVLPPGATDQQTPHSEDEVYLIVSGRGMLQVAQESIPVQTGAVVYVPAQASHRFHSITETLHSLVFFAPAEASRRHPP